MKKWLTKGGSIISQIGQGRGNSYLVQDGDISVLVDTGLKGSRNDLKAKLDDLLGGGDLSWLVLTHTHYDHVENAAWVKEHYNAQIILHQAEADYLKKGSSPLPKGTNLLASLVEKIGGKITSFSVYDPVDPDLLVDDEYQLTPKSYLMHTPGHTEGSISLIVDDEVALVGDAMFGVFWWSIFLPFADNVPLMKKSWGELARTGCKTYLPGHGTENTRELLIKQCNKYKVV
ncbi:MAG: MBL fold metallo-hydrolase [Methanobacterium sp.]|nr:MBL fold metallo-hydrolase [Methanobacterium sp.]